MKEFMIRKELGFYPEDPFKADFFLGLISMRNQRQTKKNSKYNKMQHLQELIRKNS